MRLCVSSKKCCQPQQADTCHVSQPIPSAAALVVLLSRGASLKPSSASSMCSIADSMQSIPTPAPILCRLTAPTLIPPTTAPGTAARTDLSRRLQDELALLAQAVEDTPADPITKPGDGIGIYSTGFKTLGQIELLVGSWRVVVTQTCI